VAYAASKAGLQGMIRTVAIENCALGISANCGLELNTFSIVGAN
jgi:NAD(P)-dependent dehydrogenase (short-subunit alcohol dehydrogenase family)